MATRSVGPGRVAVSDTIDGTGSDYATASPVAVKSRGPKGLTRFWFEGPTGLVYSAFATDKATAKGKVSANTGIPKGQLKLTSVEKKP